MGGLHTNKTEDYLRRRQEYRWKKILLRIKKCRDVWQF